MYVTGDFSDLGHVCLILQKNKNQKTLSLSRYISLVARGGKSQTAVSTSARGTGRGGPSLRMPVYFPKLRANCKLRPER